MSLAREVATNFAAVTNQCVVKNATIDTLVVREDTLVEGDLDVIGDVAASGQIQATGQISGGSFTTAGNVTCNTLNYTTLNPPIDAYSTVASYATLVTQTIAPGELVWSTDKAALFRGLSNPADTTILPAGSPWGVNGYLTMILNVRQNFANAPFFEVVRNELYIGTTVDVTPNVISRTGPGQYFLEFPNQVPYAGFVASVVPSTGILGTVATVGVKYTQNVGPPISQISINARDYAGAFTDLVPAGAPDGFVVTILFTP